MKLTQPILLLFLLCFLTGCYCVEPYYSKGVKSFKETTSFSLCFSANGGKSTSLTPYYGFLNTDEAAFSNELREQEITPTESKLMGTFGIRAAHWIAPSRSFPFRVLGVGADYSINSIRMNYTDPTSENLGLNRKNHRILASANVITFVQPRWLGYATFQGGVRLQRDRIIPASLPETQTTIKNAFGEYRIGYGFQFYPDMPVGISLEGGYGAGAYARAGLVFWIF